MAVCSCRFLDMWLLAGTLWYLYEATQDTVWLHAAENVTRILLPEAYRKARSHDSGFIMMPSVGNAYRLTGDTMYAQALHHAADSLAELYNPKVGTILSWRVWSKDELAS